MRANCVLFSSVFNMSTGPYVDYVCPVICRNESVTPLNNKMWQKLQHDGASYAWYSAHRDKNDIYKQRNLKFSFKIAFKDPLRGIKGVRFIIMKICSCMRRVISAGNLAEPAPPSKLSITPQSRYRGAHMIVKRRAQPPLLFRLHCVSLCSETLGAGVQNPILCSMNSRAGQGGITIAEGFGCSLSRTLWETNLWFIPSPSSSIKPAVSHQQQHSQTWKGNTFHSWWVAVIGSTDGRGSELWCLVVSHRCCCDCKYTLWEKVLCEFHNAEDFPYIIKKKNLGRFKISWQRKYPVNFCIGNKP